MIWKFHLCYPHCSILQSPYKLEQDKCRRLLQQSSLSNHSAPGLPGIAKIIKDILMEVYHIRADNYLIVEFLQDIVHLGWIMELLRASKLPYRSRFCKVQLTMGSLLMSRMAWLPFWGSNHLASNRVSMNPVTCRLQWNLMCKNQQSFILTHFQITRMVWSMAPTAILRLSWAQTSILEYLKQLIAGI